MNQHTATSPPGPAPEAGPGPLAGDADGAQSAPGAKGTQDAQSAKGTQDAQDAQDAGRPAGGPDPAATTGSPPDEAPAPGAWEAIEQLFSLAPHLRSGRANVMGDTRVSGDVVAGDKRVDVHLHGGPPSRLHSVGPLPAAELAHLAATFAPSRRYDELYAELVLRRVLVLRGRSGTGRRTAAVRMLLQAARTSGEVIALDPGTEPADFADHVRPGGAHVVVDPVTGPDGPLRDVHLHAVHRRLGAEGLFVVVTGSAVEDVTTHDWEPPPATEITRAHLLHALQQSGPEPASGGATVSERARCLLELDVSVAYLSAGPSPREAVGFARLLAARAAGRCGDEELSRYGRVSAEETAGRWFAGGGPEEGVSLRDKAFLISLAVFDGLPYPLVAELGDRLHLRLLGVEEPGRPAGHPVFAASPAERLALARAEEYPDETDTPWGRLPERVVAFRDGSLWNTVLCHVWTSHPAVRGPLLAWLDSLVADRRVTVRLRAAVASGVLAAADFGHAHDAFLDRWGSSPRPAERQLAAWSLYTAAEHGMDTAVRRLLSQWSGRPDPARRWTVARSYALLGGATATSALRDIERMAASGPEPDPLLRAAYEQTLEALLQGPAAVTVLERLVRWYGSRGPLRALAAQGFLRGARRRVRGEGPGGALWPRLLWLAEHDTATRQFAVVMWRLLLNDRERRDAARDELVRWVRCADHASTRAARGRLFTGPPYEEEPDPPGAVSDVESALCRLLPLLVETGNDRERLDFLLRRYEPPAGADGATAARLRDALAGEPPARSAPHR
ncbi:hypothetical protein [Streptomyces sp. NPDC015131]|uniref:hypothetical protein n=1 Tax=Streptomyces sp. NPDC015131 TaxID=3364941 RepID=UPI00370228CF